MSAPLTHTRALSLPHNPFFAGVFTYGKRHGRVSADGNNYYDLLPRDQRDTVICGWPVRQ